MPKQQRLRRLRRVEVSESETTSSADDESEGSLADFIEHDSAELDDDDASYRESEEEEDEDAVRKKRARVMDEEESESDTEEEEDATVTEEDPDDAIRQQYSTEMEQRGSVLIDGGVRRSMRSNKGKAPQRYVDEDYADLMLEDISPADQALLAQEFTSSSDDDGDAEFDDLGDDDEDDEEAQVQST